MCSCVRVYSCLWAHASVLVGRSEGIQPQMLVLIFHPGWGSFPISFLLHTLCSPALLPLWILPLHLPAHQLGPLQIFPNPLQLPMYSEGSHLGIDAHKARVSLAEPSRQPPTFLFQVFTGIKATMSAHYLSTREWIQSSEYKQTYHSDDSNIPFHTHYNVCSQKTGNSTHLHGYGENEATRSMLLLGMKIISQLNRVTMWASTTQGIYVKESRSHVHKILNMNVHSKWLAIAPNGSSVIH